VVRKALLASVGGRTQWTPPVEAAPLEAPPVEAAP
jgi:hypothetical protein